MIVAAVICGPWDSGMRSFSTISASWSSTVWRFRLANAVTLMSAPSSSFLVFQELDVVNQEDINVAVAAPEAVLLAVPDHVDEVVGEFFRADVPDFDALVEALRVVADGVQQVRLAESGIAVYEQWVVRLGRSFGDSHGGGVRESVAGSDDERLEGVLGVQPGRRWPHPGGTRLGRRARGMGQSAAGQVGGRVGYQAPGVLRVHGAVQRRPRGGVWRRGGDPGRGSPGVFPGIARPAGKALCSPWPWRTRRVGGFWVRLARRRSLDARGRIDRDGELDVAAEFPGEGVRDQGPEPRLQLLLDELVGRCDQGRVLDEPERSCQLEPGTLMRLDLHVSEPFQRSGPYVREV